MDDGTATSVTISNQIGISLQVIRRCEHCASCSKCVLGMDHHNPWLNNCVGFRNKKFFILTIFYAMAGIMDVLICSVPLLHSGEHQLRKWMLWLLLFSIFVYAMRLMVFNLNLITYNVTRW